MTRDEKCSMCGLPVYRYGLCRSCYKIDEDEWRREDKDEDERTEQNYYRLGVRD